MYRTRTFLAALISQPVIRGRILYLFVLIIAHLEQYLTYYLQFRCEAQNHGKSPSHT